MSAPTRNRLWRVAGGLLLAHVVLLFAGAVFTHSLQLGDEPSKAATALANSSLARNFLGGTLGYVGFLVFLVVAMLLAQLLRQEGETAAWLASCVGAAGIAYVALTVATGFAAGAAAVYNGHHGADLATATTVNDIRNFGFILSGGFTGLFALSVAATGRMTGQLSRWVSASGIVVGVLCIVAIPGARAGMADISTMLWFVWLIVLALAALRRRQPTSGIEADRAVVRT